jgi:hypothetical protein
MGDSEFRMAARDLRVRLCNRPNPLKELEEHCRACSMMVFHADDMVPLASIVDTMSGDGGEYLVGFDMFAALSVWDDEHKEAFKKAVEGL